MLRRNFLKTGLAASAVGITIQNGLADSYLANSPDMLVSYLNGRLTSLASKWDKVR